MSEALYVTTPCRRCARPVLAVTVAGGDRVTLEPGHPVYSRESDGEGAAVWLPMVGDVVIARHICMASLHAAAKADALTIGQSEGGRLPCN